MPVFDYITDRARDVFANLPDEAKIAFDRDHKRSLEALAKRRAAREHIRDMHERKRDLEVLIERHREDINTFGTNIGGPEAMARLETEKKDTLAAIRQAEEAMEPQRPPEPVTRRHAFLRDWIGNTHLPEWLAAQSPLARFESMPATVPRIKPDALPKALVESRQAQDAIIDKLRKVKSLPLDIETMVAEMRREVDRTASTGQPDLSGLARPRDKTHRGRIGWPVAHTHSFDLTKATSSQLGISFACWLFPDQVKARLEEELRAKYGKGGLSADARATKLAELEANLLEAQRVHARLCAMADDAGVPCERGLLHPLALLEIERTASAPKPGRKTPKPKDTVGQPTLGARLSAEQTRGWTAPQKT